MPLTPRPSRRAAALSMLAAGASLAAALAIPATVRAEGVPLKLIVPLAAGGPTDQSARLLAKTLAPLLGQEVLVENKAGAAGAIGAQALGAAPADGATLLYAPASLAALPMLMKAPPFRSLNDYTPLGAVGGNQICLFVHASLPVDSAQAFVAHARAHPDTLSYGSNSNAEYLAAAQVIQASGIRMTRVPYRGSAQMLPDLLENRVQLAFIPPAVGLPQVRAGKLKILGCNAPQRLPGLAELPTLVEAGLSSGSLRPYHFVLAPAALPAVQRERLAAALQKAAADPALRAEFDRLLLTQETLGPEQTQAAIREVERVWTQFVREAGIAPE